MGKPMPATDFVRWSLGWEARQLGNAGPAAGAPGPVHLH
jgi:hypothetical protein